MSNDVEKYAQFENDKCVNIIMATHSVIEEFSQKHPERFYILSKAYGLKEGDSIRRGDFREKQDDGSYKYFRNVVVGVDEQGETIYETRELIYLGD